MLPAATGGGRHANDGPWRSSDYTGDCPRWADACFPGEARRAATSSSFARRLRRVLGLMDSPWQRRGLCGIMERELSDALRRRPRPDAGLPHPPRVRRLRRHPGPATVHISTPRRLRRRMEIPPHFTRHSPNEEICARRTNARHRRGDAGRGRGPWASFGPDRRQPEDSHQDRPVLGDASVPPAPHGLGVSSFRLEQGPAARGTRFVRRWVLTEERRRPNRLFFFRTEEDRGECVGADPRSAPGRAASGPPPPRLFPKSRLDRPDGGPSPPQGQQ